MEFELYFIDPTTITTSWIATAPQILPEHIMSFSMTKNVFSGKLPNGCVASSTMSLTVDNSGGEYTEYFKDPSYWIFVANPAEDRNNGAQDFITSFHLDRAQMNQNKMVSVNGYDAIDLLDKYTISGEDIVAVFDYPEEDRHFSSVLELLDFTGLGFKLDILSYRGQLADPSWWTYPSADAFPKEDISYRQVLSWVAEVEGLMLEVSGGYTNSCGSILRWRDPTLFADDRTVYPSGLPYKVDYVIYYDNEDDPSRPMSYSSQTRDFDSTTNLGLRVYKYNSEEYADMHTSADYWVEVANNPFVAGGSNPSYGVHNNWAAFIRHNTSANKEAFCKYGYWYEADAPYNTPTPIPLRERWHAFWMGFLNHDPHEARDTSFAQTTHPAYGYVLPCPIGSYTYVCNGMETVTCDIESDTASQFTPQMTPTDSAIQELQNQVSETVNKIYPVGSVYVSETNTNPSSMFGGTWTLIDKEFTPYYNYTDTTHFTKNDTNVTSISNPLISRSGHDITLKLTFVNAVVLDDSTIALGNWNLAKIGVSSLDYLPVFLGYSDGGNGIMMMTISASGAMSIYDVVVGYARTLTVSNNTVTIPHASIASGNTCSGMVTFVVPMNRMLDSACNKFYFKRTE